MVARAGSSRSINASIVSSFRCPWIRPASVTSTMLEMAPTVLLAQSDAQAAQRYVSLYRPVVRPK